MTKAELLKKIAATWEALHARLGQMNESQLTSRRSAEGWTVKDHLAHLAVWEKSALAIARGEPRHLALGIAEADYRSRDFEQINALIQAHHSERPLAEILAEWRETHAQLLAVINALTDADLQRPDTDFLPGEIGVPLIDRIIGNTVEHYEEHLTWFSTLL